MAVAARKHDPQPYSEEARQVMRSLWRVIHNETPGSPAQSAERFDPVELQRTLELVRQSIRAERQKVAELQRRVAELEGVEDAYQAERQFAQELKADRDCWRGQAMMMLDHVPRR